MAEEKSEEQRQARLKEAFRACDTDGSGKLCFDQFFALMRKGNPKFVEDQARTLFVLCDQDMSGEVDFDEFLEYIFNNANLSRVFKLEANAEEEECKQVLLSKPGPIREAASKAVKARGEAWKDLTWKDRLDMVRELEKDAKDTTERASNAPLVNPNSNCWAPPRRAKADTARADATPASPARSATGATGSRNKAEATKPAEQKPDTSDVGSLLGAVPKSLKVMNKFAISDMDQSQLVDYSLQDEDLSFAGQDSSVKAELRAFREYMRTATNPLDEVNVIKFIAKGTAGWVFLVENKETGEKGAMKLIRMTQARSGIKEWYCSKVLRAVGTCPNVVYTNENVRVVARDTAPPVIQKELENAGPVNYYMCLTQELMPWGTLEDLAVDGELSPAIMFKCMEDVANTLAMMHKNNLQHRDVKPENIMLQMDASDSVIAAKMCDFGSAMVGDDPKSVQDDIRRFGVTLFSVATGEEWTKSRLIREKHENLVARLELAVEGSEVAELKALPQVLEQILSGSMQMSEVAEKMAELGDAFD